MSSNIRASITFSTLRLRVLYFRRPTRLLFYTQAGCLGENGMGAGYEVLPTLRGVSCGERGARMLCSISTAWWRRASYDRVLNEE